MNTGFIKCSIKSNTIIKPRIFKHNDAIKVVVRYKSFNFNKLQLS